MKNDFKVSVIIPTYNRAKTIERCLESVLKQTLQPYEIIIVDDSSNDDTVNRINKYKDPRIRCIILEQNFGAQVARNRGIIEAKGDWITFLDSDDEWLESILERKYVTLKKYNFDQFIVVYTDSFWIDHKNNHLTVKVPELSFLNSYRDLLKSPGPMFSGITASKTALQKINLLDEKVPSFQEWDTSLMLSRYCNFVFIDEKLFNYYLHKGKTISKDMRKNIQGYGYIINKFEEDMKKNKFWEKHIRRQIYLSLDYRLWEETDKYLRKLFSKNPRSLLLLFIFSTFRFFHMEPSKIKRLLKY